MESKPHQDSLGGCLARILWAFVGPGLIVLVGLSIATRRAPIGSVPDLIFAAILAASLVARFLDRPAPCEAIGDARSVDIGRTSRWKYVVGILVVAGAVYAFAHRAAF